MEFGVFQITPWQL